MMRKSKDYITLAEAAISKVEGTDHLVSVAEAWLSMAQVWATLAVAASTREATKMRGYTG